MTAPGLRYREFEVLSMAPARRFVLLFTHLLVQLRLARGHAERGEIERRTQRLTRAQEIVVELLASLDRDTGGDLAQKLAGLYGWLVGEFASLHARPDLARFDLVIRVISELHEAWSAAADLVTRPGADPLV
ncbi:MAG: flagellar export chaperone FliS [Gemmatimonadales bacterium]|nr:flagellar export chaperone FliS [Gemmatimonadales bacterium]